MGAELVEGIGGIDFQPNDIRPIDFRPNDEVPKDGTGYFARAVSYVAKMLIKSTTARPFASSANSPNFSSANFSRCQSY